mgnify:CR=1 FL=1
MSASLPIRLVEKPWGKDILPAPFTRPDKVRTGEIWFEPPEELPGLLVKYIFTSEKLSVQVHPSDTQTQRAGLGRQGKEECWLVIDTEPGATLGIGFREPLSSEAMRAAALDGSIEGLLEWHSVKPGDFFYIPANTVHAIGAGVSLIEVQQNSDITYRLYDYGRPRELHLDDAIAVAQGAPYPPSLAKSVAPAAAMTLVEGPLFRFDQLSGPHGAETALRYRGPLLAIPRSGMVRIDGAQLAPGQCGLARSIDEIDIPSGSTCLIAQPI